MTVLMEKRRVRRLRPLEEGLLALAVALGAVFAALALLGDSLYFTLGKDLYSVLHLLLEIASVLVSFSVFIVNWEASKQNRNSHTLFIAAGFLTVAMGDVMHTLSFPDMPPFVTANSVEKSIYFWLFARLWASSTLLIAAFVHSSSSNRFLSRYTLSAMNLLACFAVFVAVTYHQEGLPRLFVDGVGVTQMKLALEYVVIFISLIASIVYTRRYRLGHDGAVLVLVAALVVSVFSELSSIQYRDPFDVYSLLGHAYKVVACYLVFRALIITSVERPYIQLSNANKDLGQAVAELNERTRELDALDEVALTLSSSLKPEELLASAIEKVMSVMQAESGAIFLTDDETSQMRMAAWKGLKASAVARIQTQPGRLQVHGGVPSSSQGRTALDDPALVRSIGGSAAHIGPFRSCVCAPVSTKGELLGAIAMIASEGHSFAPADADLLTAVGYQLGLAIENARLYGRTDEQLREKLSSLRDAERKSRFLAEAAALLASSMDLDLVLGAVSRKASEVVGDWCAVYIVDEAGAQLKLAAVHHEDSEELASVRDILARAAIPVGEGLVGRAAKTGEATLVTGDSVRQLTAGIEALVDRPEELAVLHRASPSSAIVAPMAARGMTVGVLLVMETHSSSPMTESDLALVKELGDRAGIAIQNSQLLEESQQRRRHLEATISQMVDGVIIADADGRFVMSNAAAEQMLSGNLQVTVRISEDIPLDNQMNGGQAQASALVARALRGAPLIGEEILVKGATRERVLSASASTVRDDLGEVTGAVVVMRDVTRERELDRMKDEFVATVSHELRTPITAVLGYTDLMLRGMRGPLMPQQVDALTAVRNAGRRLLTLIEDLLDLSKLEAGKQELCIDVVDVSRAVERALASVAVTASAKQVALLTSVPSDLPPVLADDLQLQRILGNLLSNAVKFTSSGGTVTVKATSSSGEDERRSYDGWVAFTISDTGIGISSEQQERIWERFQQADSSSARLYGGTGLGLTIVKSLVELHGGKVWVESEGIAGLGSTFGFMLPAADTASWRGGEMDTASGGQTGDLEEF